MPKKKPHCEQNQKINVKLGTTVVTPQINKGLIIK